MSEAYDFGDALPHVCPVELGGKRVDLIIRSPGRVVRALNGRFDADPVDAQEALAAALREAWPETGMKLPDNDTEAFQALYDAYGMVDLVVAADRLSSRVGAMYPSVEEVAERARSFPGSKPVDG